MVLIYQCQDQGVNLKKLVQSHHSQQNEHFNRYFLRYTYEKDNSEGLKL